ncbi:MAG: Rrf2 family transcriptional regulator [Rhodospirillales bacterium]
MRLTVQSDYALRAMMYLAARTEQLATVAGISGHYGVSRNHMTKVLHHLVRGGFVRSVRGRSGGVCLAAAADQITVGQVVRYLEADGALVECFRSDGGDCLLSPDCRLKSVLAEAVDGFYAVLDRYSIQSLLSEKGVLLKLLADGEKR